MSKQYQKLLTLLKELFQTNEADLDFGLYKVINQRRDEINRFLDEELLPQVKAAFSVYQSMDKKTLEVELAEAIKGAEKLGIDPDTVPKVHTIREQVATYSVDVDDLENQVYSALFNFFRRYYDNGDFISQRRYKDGVYAIPYEGEEVKLYWAKYDQYYIKTSEYLRDYIFKLPSGNKAHFKLIEADIEKDNRKETDDKKRRFILAEEPLLIENGEISILFEFRPDAEKQAQKKLNEQAVETIIGLREQSYDQVIKDALAELATLSPTESDKNRTLLAKHLEDYTRRNTQDYFIHKDLRKFLRRELDFFIKNEIMDLDNIENEGVPKVEQYLNKIKVIRQIAHKLIDFLAQIEDLQKKLWLKKKFVVETNYCITLNRIPEELYTEISTNDAQREEWVRLFTINEIQANGDIFKVSYSEPLTVEFLKANPFLVIDTKFFDQDFKYKLLASIENLDDYFDGLLIKSENFQAIKLLHNVLSEKVKCIHIDPPYNTQTSGFLYKNNYQHSSWLSMMQNRIEYSISLLSSNGSFLCHIDENEYENLYLLFNSFPVPNAGTISWDKRNPMNAGRGIATQHEYIIWRSTQETPIYLRNKNVSAMMNKADEIITKHGEVSEQARREYAEWINSNSNLSGGEKAYRYLDEQGQVYQSVSLRAPEPRTDQKFFKPLIHPITEKPCSVPPNGFSRTPESLMDMIKQGEIIFGRDETTQPRQKVLLTQDTKRQVSSVIQDGKKGKTDVVRLGVNFPYCHPVSLYEELLGSVVREKNDTVLDFFAGSGTTGHAVINLNREDKGRRRYILVEMAQYFDTVLKPRIQKVLYSEDWKNGKPISQKGSSHAFKYIKLESYEDTLNNLELRRTNEQAQALLSTEAFKEDYLLHYMLDFESKGSLLDLQIFNNPFDYQLKIASSTVGETIPTRVDLVETFNYLIGLQVRTIRRVDGVVLVEGQTRENRRVLVIWRNIDDLDSEMLNTFFKEHFADREKDLDVIYVNGDNTLQNICPLDATWNVHLTEEEFHYRMFEIQE